MLSDLHSGADVYDRKEHIKRQLNTLMGREVRGGLLFQGGPAGRACGGALFYTWDTVCAGKYTAALANFIHPEIS